MKIAIAGYGIEGEANYTYWSRMPEADITIVDESEAPKHPLPEGVKTQLGAGSFGALSEFDLVIRTASLSPYKLTSAQRIWSATNEFFLQCEQLGIPIIGVTGTKGKGTTASMIASVLEAAGKKVWLVGNIGTAALSVLDQIKSDDAVVYELSSFQLWDIERSPHTAVILPIEPEHLDIHKDFDDYLQAKGNIRRFQKNGDVCIYNPENEYSRQLALKNVAGTAIPYTDKDRGGVYVQDGFFKQSEHIICSTDELQLKGKHNFENACAALTVARTLGIDNDAIAAGLRNFKGLPHRLEFVRELDGVQYYNDSFSSSTPATIAAARAFDQPEILIIGGVDRGGDFEYFAQELADAAHVKAIILIGEIRHKLQDIFRETALSEKIQVSDVRSMEEIVRLAHASATPGDVVILSPGCASFDMFKDFSDRGNQFKMVVQTL